MDWITIKEAAESWGISTRRAQFLCEKGKVVRAQKLGNMWVVPRETPKPIDGRTKEAKHNKMNNSSE